jgi:hypothetical protein
MPSKIRLTAEQKRQRLITDYRLAFQTLDPDSQATLKEIEENRYGMLKFEDPLKEAAETFKQWKDERVI